MAKNGERHSTKNPDYATIFEAHGDGAMAQWLAYVGYEEGEIPEGRLTLDAEPPTVDIKPSANEPPPQSDIDTRRHHVTFFKNAFAFSLDVKTLTLPEMRDLVLKPKRDTKDVLPWLKLAKFGKKKTDKKSLRHDDNVIGFNGIELDYDKEVMSFDEAVAILKTMNVRVLIYTSPSHTDAAPRWRLLFPLNHQYDGKATLETRGKLCARVNGRFGQIFSTESFTLSQSYYYGQALDNPAPHHRAEILDGRMLDICMELLKFQDDGWPKGKSKPDDKPDDDKPDGKAKSKAKGDDGNTKSKTKADDSAGANPFEEYGDEHDGVGQGFEAYIAKMGDGEGLEGFNGPLISASSSYACTHGADLDRAVLKRLLRAAINNAPKAAKRKPADIERYLSDNYLDALIASAVKKFGEAIKTNDILRLNMMHAVLPIGGKTRVVTFGEMEEFPGRETIVMTQTTGDFVSLNNKYRHEYIDGKGKPQEIGMGTYWMMSRKRRQYDGGMAFMPRQNKKVVGNKLNLWNGYGVLPIKPDGKSGASGCNLFLSFMLEVICNKNEEHFEYLRKREAFILQKRMRCEVALGLRSEEEGVGKGFYERTMGHLLGNHYMEITNPKHIIGAFNPHLETLLRLTADEALFVGNPEHRNMLFGLITEPKISIEPKGCGVYQADNYLNTSILSNAAHFLPVSGTARRFLIPTVSPAHMQDTVYFAAIQKQLDDGGYEALLYHLLNEVDLKDFNVRVIPVTEGMIEQRGHSLQPLESWWCELLETGTLWGSDPFNPNRAVSCSYPREIEVDNGANAPPATRLITQKGLFDQAKSIEPRLRNHYTDTRLGTFLKEQGCINSRPLRRTGWTFPRLLICRAEWEKKYPNWPWRNTGLTEWQPEETDANETNTLPEVGDEYSQASYEDAAREAEADAAKAEERARRLAKAAETAKARAKFRNRK